MAAGAAAIKVAVITADVAAIKVVVITADAAAIKVAVMVAEAAAVKTAAAGIHAVADLFAAELAALWLKVESLRRFSQAAGSRG